jgi:LPS export ABC transporter protein LptC
MSLSRIFTKLARRRLRPWLMALVAALVITEIVALSPAPLEEASSSSSALVDPETLTGDDEVTLATGIPKEKIPEYSVDQFQYVSTQASEKQWKLLADRAFLYNKEKLVHARKIHAFLYDPDGKITIVTGKEAKYFMNQRDLEVFGDVHTTFPDGFELLSDYLRYKPNERKILIPQKYVVHGDGHEKEGQNIRFVSRGMDFAMGRSEIILPEDVHMTMEKPAPKAPAPGPSGKPSEPDRTTIESDKAVIHRDRQIAYFTMYPTRPLEQRFVHITQPTLFTRARRAQLNYGDFSKLLQYMIAFDDVLIKETGKQDEQDGTLKYATGGRADFDSRSDVIKLTEFPQCYQDNDTVTGDIIIMHRDTDLVEVENSNAFSQGSQ